jgi:gliding motility-associated-like protein
MCYWVNPKGDDRNQRLVPERYANIAGASFQIINRYGREVYTGNNLANGWDGEGCGEGLYFYTISFTGTNGEKGSAKGWVHLIR